MLGLIARPYPTTYTAGAAAVGWSATYPGTNLDNNDFGRIAKSNAAIGPAAFNVMVDLGSSRAVDTVGLLWHNLRAGDAITSVRAGDTAAGAEAGTLYASGSLSPITGASKRDVTPLLWKFLHTLPNTVTARYWILNITINTSTLIFQASKFFVGKKTVFGIGYQKASMGAVDLNQRATLETGEERATEDTQLIKPVIGLDLNYAKESEMADVLGAYTLSLGTSRPMLVTPDATGAYLQDTLAFGRPERVITNQSDSFDMWSFSCSVPSLGP